MIVLIYRTELQSRRPCQGYRMDDTILLQNGIIMETRVVFSNSERTERRSPRENVPRMDGFRCRILREDRTQCDAGSRAKTSARTTARPFRSADPALPNTERGPNRSTRRSNSTEVRHPIRTAAKRPAERRYEVIDEPPEPRQVRLPERPMRSGSRPGPRSSWLDADFGSRHRHVGQSGTLRSAVHRSTW